MKILIGVDGSPCSDAALSHVAQSIWPAQASFLVLSAVPPVFIGPGEVGPHVLSELIGQQKEYHRGIAERAAARLARAGLKVTARATYGDPRTILEETARSERVDLMVVGSHGRSGIKKLLLGSVAGHVVMHAPCPVLVVKMPAPSVDRTERKTAVRVAMPV